MTDPWSHPGYAPTDPLLRALVLRVIAASGGAGIFGPSKDDVAASLESWFSATIPDLLAGSLDDAAIDSHALFLQDSEGTGLPPWGAAITARFQDNPRWNPCFEQRHRLVSGDCGYAPQHVLLRGMLLYSAAFARLAATMGVRRIRVYRALPASPTRWLPNAIANTSWTPTHFAGRGLAVRFADVHPAVVVGVTLGHECHPLIAPFDIGAGPGHRQVEFARAPGVAGGEVDDARSGSAHRG